MHRMYDDVARYNVDKKWREPMTNFVQEDGLFIVRNYLRYVRTNLLPLSHKIKPLWPFFLGPQNKTTMSDNSYGCKLRSFQRAQRARRSADLCFVPFCVIGCGL